LLNRFSNKVSPIYDLIKQRVSQSSLIGADETGIKVNGDNHWFWAWQTPKLTFIAHAPNRKAESITALFPKGFPNSTLVHDGWKPQLNTPAKNHQTCLAHLQRHLIYLNKVYPDSTWGNSFLKLLYQSLELKPKLKQKDYCIERKKIRLNTKSCGVIKNGGTLLSKILCLQTLYLQQLIYYSPKYW
jgi:transposase